MKQNDLALYFMAKVAVWGLEKPHKNARGNSIKKELLLENSPLFLSSSIYWLYFLWLGFFFSFVVFWLRIKII